jgi:hypothetical protein
VGTRSNSETILSDLAQRINEHDSSRRACEVKSVMHAMRIGQLLLEAKEVTPHGQFLKWAEANTTVTPRMCQMYMRIAGSDRIRGMVEGEYETVSHLTIAKAVKLAREEKKLDEIRKQCAAEINEGWAQLQKSLKVFADHLRIVRGTFPDDDEAFIRFQIDRAGLSEDLAHKLPDLLDGEYDEQAWLDAFLTDENIEWMVQIFAEQNAKRGEELEHKLNLLIDETDRSRGAS